MWKLQIDIKIRQAKRLDALHGTIDALTGNGSTLYTESTDGLNGIPRRFTRIDHDFALENPAFIEIQL